MYLPLKYAATIRVFNTADMWYSLFHRLGDLHLIIVFKLALSLDLFA